MNTIDGVQGLPRRRSGIEVQSDGGSHTLRDPASGTACVVNDTALAVWELCDGTTAPEEMVASICMVFDATPDRVLADLEEILATLTDAGALEWPAARAPSRSLHDQ